MSERHQFYTVASELPTNRHDFESDAVNQAKNLAKNHPNTKWYIVKVLVLSNSNSCRIPTVPSLLFFYELLDSDSPDAIFFFMMSMIRI
jgi:hypothetical protein